MSQANDNVISIPEYFAGQSILITGGTGLMGKVLIEKILRSCPQVANIYLLIRTKKNVAIEERWSKLTELQLFDRLKKERADALKKIVLVPGNIQDEDICPSETYKKMLEENVTIVYHAAAMIQFTDSVTDALIQNVRGTLSLLEMAKRMTKLKAFVYVSTAYSNFDIPCAAAEERVLPSCQDWKIIMRLLQTDPDALVPLKEKLLCNHPNPYTWSKSLAEQIVNEFNMHFPVVIMRPAVVSCTVEDPFPSWNDGTNICFAFGAALALGVLHVSKVTHDQFQDLIPVDVAIKAFLIAPWKLHLSGHQKTTPVYNCATAKDVSLTYSEMEGAVKKLLEEYPSKNILWDSFWFSIQNRFLYELAFFFLQLVPGVLLDLLLLAMNRKPMFNSINIKFVNGYRLAERIMCNQVAFPNERFKELATYVKEQDRESFYYGVDKLDINKTDITILQGIAFFKYYLKEDMSEKSKAKNRKRYHRIKFMHKSLVFIASFSLCLWTLSLIGQSTGYLVQRER